MRDTTVYYGGHTWSIQDGYVSRDTTPGSQEDTTAGKIGRHQVYIQYANGPEADYIRAEILPRLWSREDRILRARKNRQNRKLPTVPVPRYGQGYCPRCQSYCYGDCRGY